MDRPRLRILRVSSGQSQRILAARSGISQTFESDIERGDARASIETLASLAEASGGRLIMRIAPGSGVSLRDSGQLEIVQLIIGRRDHVDPASGTPGSRPGRPAGTADGRHSRPVEVVQSPTAYRWGRSGRPARHKLGTCDAGNGHRAGLATAAGGRVVSVLRRCGCTPIPKERLCSRSPVALPIC